MSKLYVSNKDETVRLFRNDLLERLSHVQWFVPIVWVVPVVGYMIYRAVSAAVSPVQIVAMFISGLLIWTLAEYVMHRFVFHFKPSGTLGKKIMFLFHGIHHDYPSDSLRLVMPPALAFPLAAMFYTLFLVLFGALRVSPVFAGFLTGYLFYDLIHYAAHHVTLPGSFGRYVKRHHIRHHFRNPQRNYGVSTPLWDFVFGTYDMPQPKH